jgi:hypothetical protein
MPESNFTPITGQDHEAYMASVEKSAIRQLIEQGAGDPASQMGTMSDAVHILLYGVASLVAKLATAQSLAEVREAATPFAELSGSFLAKVQAGQVRLPMMAKPFESVVADIEQRATATADAIAAVRPPIQSASESL